MSQEMLDMRVSVAPAGACAEWFRTRIGTLSLPKVLLALGFLSSLLYVGSDIAASLRYEGYNYFHQAFSELLALGSPVRSFMLSYSFAYNLLVLACAYGVWKVAENKRALRWSATCLFIYGVSSLIGPYVPMHVRGAGTSLTDILHIVDTFAMVAAIVGAMGFGAFAFGKGFKFYSLASVVTLISFGAWSGTQIPLMVAGQPTPWLGVIERMNIYPLMLWIAVLAIVLLRQVRGTRSAERSAVGTATASPIS